MGWGLGKSQKEERGDRAEEHQEAVGKGKEEVQTHESEQHPGESVKNPPGEIERLCLKARQQSWT